MKTNKLDIRYVQFVLTDIPTVSWGICPPKFTHEDIYHTYNVFLGVRFPAYTVNLAKHLRTALMVEIRSSTKAFQRTPSTN